MEAPIKCPQNWINSTFHRPTPVPNPLQIHDTFVPWASAVHYLGLVLDSKLHTKHLHAVIKKATGVLCPIFPLIARDSTLTQSNKLTLYKLLVRSILTYAAPVSSSTCPSNYLKPQVIQLKCHRVIGNYPRHTPTSHLHDMLNTEPISDIIHRFATIFLAYCLSHPTAWSNKSGITLQLTCLPTMYKEHKHKCPKRILL
jgi:hypothetical protein